MSDLADDIRKRLVQNALQATWYVVQGDVLHQELQKKHDFDSKAIRAELDRQAVQLDKLLRDYANPQVTHHPGTDKVGHPVSECAARGCKR